MPSQIHACETSILLHQTRVGTAYVLMIWVGQKVLILKDYLDYVSREY